MNIDKLLRPIPNSDAVRLNRDGYREYALDQNDPRNAESLVDAAEYGLAGQSYYSRPNAATRDPVPEVPSTIFIRKTIAEKLQNINQALQKSPEATELFGGLVELYIDEGIRARTVQALLYNDVFPRIIRAQNPDMTEEQVMDIRNRRVAKPADGADTPSPHATGAAVDIKLRFVRQNKGFVPDSFVDMGSGGANMSGLVHPDYFEHDSAITDERSRAARRHRRAFYWIMNGALNDQPSQLVVNPMEWWHWSYGDQMWAKTTHAKAAFYGFPPQP